jgi:hypothetical protein
MVQLLPGDIVLTRSKSLIGSAIRYFEARPGDPAWANHVGIIVTAGTDFTAVLVEALWKVRRGPLWDLYGPPAGPADKRPEIQVYRLCEPLPDHRQAAAAHAETFVGRRYGVHKIAAHAADWWLTRKLGAEVFAFRRLLRMDRYPICSYLVADAWAQGGVSFEVPPGSADPDHVHDYLLKPGVAQLIYAGVLGAEA